MTNSICESRLLEEFEQLHLMSSNSTVIKPSVTLPTSSSGLLGLGNRPLTPVTTSTSTVPPCKPYSRSSGSTNILANGALLPQQPVVRPSNISQSAFQMPSGSTARSLAQIARSAQVPAGQLSGLRGIALNSPSIIPNSASTIKPNPNSVPCSTAKSSVSNGDCISFSMVPIASMSSDANPSLGLMLSRPVSRSRMSQAPSRAASAVSTSSFVMSPKGSAVSAGGPFEEVAARFSIACQREAAIAREAAFAPARAAPVATMAIRPFAFDTPSPDDLALLRRQRNLRS